MIHAGNSFQASMFGGWNRMKGSIPKSWKAAYDAATAAQKAAFDKDLKHNYAIFGVELGYRAVPLKIN